MFEPIVARSLKHRELKHNYENLGISGFVRSIQSDDEQKRGRELFCNSIERSASSKVKPYPDSALILILKHCGRSDILVNWI
jgi:hypothetical protein